MFIYFQTQSGFNDILTAIQFLLNYCIRSKRILLLDTVNGIYNINFSDYFEFKHPLVICDFNKIKNILKENEKSVHPEHLEGNLHHVITGDIRFKWTIHGYEYDGAKLDLPLNSTKKVVMFASVGGGDGINVFHKYVFLKPSLRNHCNINLSKINRPYICVQVRNTDHKCDYKKLYEDNKSLLHSYNSVYIATDDKHCLKFFNEMGLNVYNFVTFSDTYRTIHQDMTLDPDTKIKDLMTDICMITMADKLISNSKGFFIHFVRSCNQHSELISSKFKDTDTL